MNIGVMFGGVAAMFVFMACAIFIHSAPKWVNDFKQMREEFRQATSRERVVIILCLAAPTSLIIGIILSFIV